MGEDCQGFHTRSVVGPSWRVYLPCRNHAGDAAMGVAVDEVHNFLPGLVIPDGDMEVGVYKTGQDSGAVGVDDGVGGVGVQLVRPADGANLAILHQHAVAPQQGLIQVSRSYCAYVDDGQAGHRANLQRVGLFAVVAHLKSGAAYWR